MKIMRLFSRLNVGGPAIHVVNLTHGLKQRGFESILVVGKISAPEGDMSFYAAEKGVVPVFIPEFQAPISPLKDLIAFYKIIRLMQREKPDVVHTHTFKAGLLGRLAAFLTRVPLRVHTYHGHLLEGYGGRLKSLIISKAEKVLSLLTHQVIAVSENIAQDLVKKTK